MPEIVSSGFLRRSRAVQEGEDAFVSHVENEVDDAEVGQEGMFLAEDLIVGSGAEVWLWVIYSAIVGGSLQVGL